MERSFEKKPEMLDPESIINLKNELQIRLMVDAGITPDDDSRAQEWIDSNASRLSDIFTPEVALKYQRDPSDVTLEIKQKLYH
jgi:hypothetical protein